MGADLGGGRRRESGFTCRAPSPSPLITAVFSLAGGSPTCAADFLSVRVVEMENKSDFPHRMTSATTLLFISCAKASSVFSTQRHTACLDLSR